MGSYRTAFRGGLMRQFTGWQEVFFKPPNYQALMDRRHPRQAVDRPAKRFTSRSMRARSVASGNFSKGGAKIRITRPGWLSDTFELQDGFTQAKRECGWCGEKPPTSECALPTRRWGPRRVFQFDGAAARTWLSERHRTHCTNTVKEAAAFVLS